MACSGREQLDGASLSQPCRSVALEQAIGVQSQELASVRHHLAVVGHQRAEREAEIAAMKQSRFWKAREQWFALKAKF